PSTRRATGRVSHPLKCRARGIWPPLWGPSDRKSGLARSSALLPGPVEPRPEHFDVGGVYGRSAPDTQARRRIAVGSDVVGGMLRLEQPGHGLGIGPLDGQADAGSRSNLRAPRQIG